MTRKPRLLLRLEAVFLLRLETREFLALLFQLPPRFTRLTSVFDESPWHFCAKKSDVKQMYFPIRGEKIDFAGSFDPLEKGTLTSSSLISTA